MFPKLVFNLLLIALSGGMTKAKILKSVQTNQISNIYDCVNSSCKYSDLQIVIGVYPLYPLSIVSKRDRSGLVKLEGIIPELANYFFHSFNISYVVAKKYPKVMAHAQPNGSWTDYYGMVQDKQLHLFWGDDGNDEAKFGTFRTTGSWFSSALGFLASKGKKSDRNFFTFLYTIDTRIWLCLFVAIVCLVLTSAVADLQSQGFLLSQVYHYIFVYLAAFFNEGTPRAPFTRRSQALLMTWLLCILVLSCAITGQFKAAIMMANNDMMWTVQDIVDRPKIMPYLLANHTFADTITKSVLPHYRQLYDRILKNPKKVFIGVHELMTANLYQKVKDGEGVLLLPKLVIDLLLPNHCTSLKGNRELYILEETLRQFDPVMVANKDFPDYLLEKINNRIMRCKECGVIGRPFIKYTKHAWKCFLKNSWDDSEGQLMFKHLSSVFFLLIYCHCLAFFVLICEIIVFKIKQLYFTSTSDQE